MAADSNPESTSFTQIDTLGRRKLIERIASNFEKHDQDLIFGIGDDAAVVKKNEQEHQLFSSELFIEGTDFDLTYTPMQHLGFKVVSMAVSDICAMNGTPEYLMINLGLTNMISVEMVDLFYKGVHAACSQYGVKLVGGDIRASRSVVSIAVSVTGVSENTVYRSGAKPGEAVCVTGDLGAAACGLMILLREKKHWESMDGKAMDPDLEPYEYVVRRQLVPEARLDLIRSMKEHSVIPGAMIDLTQGLNRNLLDLTEASGTGAYIYEAALPVSPETRAAADELEEDIDKFVLYGGEDSELMFTLPEKMVTPFAKQFKDFVVIGRITPKNDGVKMQTAEGHVMTLH